MATCVNTLTEETLLGLKECFVKDRKCLIIDSDSMNIKLKLLCVTQYLVNRWAVNALQRYGTVCSVTREKWL